MIEFNIDGWFASLMLTPDDYSHLQYYVNNNEARRIYLKSINITMVDLRKEKKDDQDVIIYDYDSDEYKKTYLDLIDSAFYRYSNQMLVILSSYLELIIQEFFEVFFYHKPNKMKNTYAYLDIESLLKTESKKELITILSKIAATNATKGGLKSKIEKIEKLFKVSIDEKLKNNLITLIKHRNKIVHDNSLFDVNYDIINRTSDNIVAILKELGLILKRNKIPINDKGGLIG